MKKNLSLLFAIIMVLTIYVSAALAQNIMPAGKQVGRDKQGNAIYQVHANGIDIGYKLIGSGEPMVMIMGLGGTMEHWHPKIIAAFSKKYQLIIMDNRGMGYTTANDTTFNYKLFADDVIGLMDSLGVKKTNVLQQGGYSRYLYRWKQCCQSPAGEGGQCAADGHKAAGGHNPLEDPPG